LGEFPEENTYFLILQPSPRACMDIHSSSFLFSWGLMNSSSIKSVKSLEVVLKISERCNINCTYCYFFNSINDDYKKHPPFISEKTLSDFNAFLIQAVQEMRMTEVSIDFHGGEPMMMKPRRFAEMCDIFQNGVGKLAKLNLGIQTNAMLVNAEWIDLFERYSVAVGVSLDGPKEYNDVYRVGHKNEGTYDRTAQGIQLLQEASFAGRIPSIGALVVMNPQFDAVKIYKHLRDDLGFETIDFLLPDNTRDTLSVIDRGLYSKQFVALYNEWAREHSTKVSVRFLRQAMHQLMHGPNVLSLPRDGHIEYSVITVASNGDIGPDDILKVVDKPFFATGLNVECTTLKEFLNSDCMRYLREQSEILPDACSDCSWQKICRGGELYHRYSRSGEFNGASVYCRDLKVIYTHLTSSLVKSGVSLDTIKSSLNIASA
jgi:uncharacterized protein